MATSSAPTLSALRHHTRSSLLPRPSKAVRAMLRRKRPSARRPRRRGLRCVQPAVIVDDVPAWLSDWHALCIDGACSYPAHCCCAGTGGLLHVASPCWRSRPDRHAVAPSSLQRRLLAFLATGTRIQEGACAWCGAETFCKISNGSYTVTLSIGATKDFFSDHAPCVAMSVLV